MRMPSLRRRRAAADRGRSGRPAPENVVAFPEPARRPRRWLRWLLAALALVGLVAGALVLYFSPVLAVDRIEVDGTRLVDRGDVLERLEPLHGMPLPQIGRGRVADLAADLPGVESLDVIAAPPTGLQVTVRERRPVAVRGTDGAAHVLMDDGAVLREVPQRALAGARLVPVTAGVLRADEQTRRAVAEAVAALPDDLRGRIDRVDASGAEAIELSVKEGPVVHWGGADQPQVKAAVVESLLDRTDEDPVGVIDVSVPDRPVTR